MASGEHTTPNSLGANWQERIQQALVDQGFRDVQAEPTKCSDFTAVWGGIRHVFQLKISRGRAQELQRALAAAVLEAQHHAGATDTPVGIVGVESISTPMRDELKAYAARILSDAPWGLIDGAGGLSLHLPHGDIVVPPSAADLGRGTHEGVPKRRSTFSDLDQWMLKVLMSPELAPEFRLVDGSGQKIDQPVGHVAELARKARVSTGTAHGFVRRLREDGYCAQRGPLKLHDLSGLLLRWISMAGHPAQARTRFALPGPDFAARFKAYVRRQGAKLPSVCVGQFVGMEHWGLRHVVGAPALIHARFPDVAMRDLGLIAVATDESAEVIVRLPRFPESTFRGLVHAEGLLVADPIQCLHDIAATAARGEEMTQLVCEHLFPQLSEPPE